MAECADRGMAKCRLCVDRTPSVNRGCNLITWFGSTKRAVRPGVPLRPGVPFRLFERLGVVSRLRRPTTVGVLSL